MINEFIITSPKQEHSASDTASPETIHDSGQIRTKDPFRSSGVQKLSWRGFKATACCNKHLETRVIAMRITPDLIKWIKVHAQRRADFSISGVTELLLFSYAICVAAVFIKPNCIIWLISHKKTAATGVTPLPQSPRAWVDDNFHDWCFWMWLLFVVATLFPFLSAKLEQAGSYRWTFRFGSSSKKSPLLVYLEIETWKLEPQNSLNPPSSPISICASVTRNYDKLLVQGYQTWIVITAM